MGIEVTLKIERVLKKFSDKWSLLDKDYAVKK